MRAFHSGLSPVIHLDETSVLDIGACVVGGVDLAPGRAIPDDGDPRIDHSLEGFLFTCGPDHIRHPQPIAGNAEGKKYPLHGSFSSHPAEIIDWVCSDDNARATARVPVTLADGGMALLEREWRIDGSTGEVQLHDRVTNTSDHAQPVFHMYHMNVGAWLLDDGVRLSGAMFQEGGFGWRFGDEPGSVFCVQAVQENEGGQAWAEMSLGPIAAVGGKTLKVAFRSDTLPFLQMWRNQQAPANVVGIEPVSHRWVDRAELEKSGEFNMLQPGESRTYALRFRFV